MDPTAEAQFDELIHAPIRLRICANLAPVQWVEFAHLRDALEVADSVLSKHLKQLSDAGYVHLERFIKSGRSHVRADLTRKGRKAYVGHVAALKAIVQTAE
jgi:DNA-binding transcriptional ArsR family regulator